MAEKNVMAANKPDGSKATKSNYKIKVFFCGDTPEEKGHSLEYGDILGDPNSPWLIKLRLDNGLCRQYADTLGIYHRISHDFDAILDAIIVNAKQRKAVGKIVDDMLWNYLGKDMSYEGDSIADPNEFWG